MGTDTRRPQPPTMTSDMRCRLDALYRSHQPEVKRYVRRRCGDANVAHDVTAATFASAAVRFAEGRGDTVSIGWLMTVAKRRLIDHWRGVGRDADRLGHLTIVSEAVSAPDDDPTSRIVIRRVLASMEHRQREALVLRYLGALSVDEVARRLGVSYEATESLLARARRCFRHRYAEATAPTDVGPLIGAMS